LGRHAHLETTSQTTNETPESRPLIAGRAHSGESTKPSSRTFQKSENPFILAGVPELCPMQPIDCSTVFQNNVGQDVDPAITDALVPLIQELH
jgi:hypothetical protein